MNKGKGKKMNGRACEKSYAKVPASQEELIRAKAEVELGKKEREELLQKIAALEKQKNDVWLEEYEALMNDVACSTTEGRHALSDGPRGEAIEKQIKALTLLLRKKRGAVGSGPVDAQPGVPMCDEIEIRLSGFTATYHKIQSDFYDFVITYEEATTLITELREDLAMFADEYVDHAREWSGFSQQYRELRKAVDNLPGALMTRQLAAREALVETWEELAADEVFHNIVPDVQQSLLGKVEISFPEYAELEKVCATSAGQASKSRVASCTLAMMRAARRALQNATDGCKPVVFEVRGNAASFERMKILKGGRNKKYAGLYVHVNFPLVDQKDVRVLDALKATPDWKQFNCVASSGASFLNTINYCHHEPNECDCLQHYTEGHRAVFSVHQFDAMSQRDYENIFRWAPIMEGVVCMALDGEFPVDAPTHRVEKACDAGDIFDRVADHARRLFTGVGRKMHVPINEDRASESTSDMLPYIAAGGFHHYPFNTAVERYAADPVRALASGFCIFGSAAVAFWATARGLPASVGLVGGLVAGANALITTTLYGLFMQRLKRVSKPLPLLGCSGTTTFKVKQSFHPENAPPEYAIVSAEHGAPRVLEPAAVGRRVVEVAEIGRVTAALVMCKDKAKATAQVAAQMLRNQVPPSRVRGVLDQAQGVVQYLNLDCRNPRDPPWYKKSLLAFSSLPLASALCLMQLSLLDAALIAFPQNCIVTALLRGVSTRKRAIAAVSLLFVWNLGLAYLTCVVLAGLCVRE